MEKINKNQQEVLNIVHRYGPIRSSEIYEIFRKNEEAPALVTIKRVLSKLQSEGFLSVSGMGPSTAYVMSEYGKLMSAVDAAEYCLQEPDARYGSEKYDFNLFSAINFDPFLSHEKDILFNATELYKNKIKGISEGLHKKELERFVIELSWKSSKIEGNTYTLLDTENLILYGIEAPGHSKHEAQMILNHKEAFVFVHDNKNKFAGLTLSNLIDLHKIIVRGLNIEYDIRSKPVGITGSRYRPLDNKYQITEAVNALSEAVNRLSEGYAKAMLALLGISYIQPFEDGNKRTSRLMANAILLSCGLPPLSYRSIDEKKYREALTVFYELNSIIPFKNIFIEQYDFAARNYLVD